MGPYFDTVRTLPATTSVISLLDFRDQMVPFVIWKAKLDCVQRNDLRPGGILPGGTAGRWDMTSPRPMFETGLPHNEDGANIKRHVFGKLSTKRSFMHSIVLIGIDGLAAERVPVTNLWYSG